MQLPGLAGSAISARRLCAFRLDPTTTRADQETRHRKCPLPIAVSAGCPRRAHAAGLPHPAGVTRADEIRRHTLH
jgi:hypothetical protein